MTQPVLITVNGTGVPDPFGPGFAGDVGRGFAANPWQALQSDIAGVNYSTLLDWQPIGYPAAVFPMGASVAAGRAEVNRQISLRPKGTPIAMSGYSQGAVVTGKVWRDDILSPAGQHHDRLADVIGIIQFGDPLRCPGIARGNIIAGMSMPKTLDGQITGGIGGPECLTPDQTPDFYLSCALDGDLYACAPVGAHPWNREPSVGVMETRIYQIIMLNSPMSLMGIVNTIMDEFNQPIQTTIGVVEAILNGLTFATQGTNAAHWQYQSFVPAMIDWLNIRANSTAAST